MKQCQCCLKKGIFLKLTNGLCQECLIVFNNTSNTYNNLISRIASKSDSFDNLLKDINTLSSELEKFDSTELPLKSANCETLKSMLNELYTPKPINTPKHIVEVNTVPNKLLNETASTTQSIKPSIQLDNTTPVSINSGANIPVKKEPLLTNTIVKPEPSVTNSMVPKINKTPSVNNKTLEKDYSKSLKPVCFINSNLFESIEETLPSDTIKKVKELVSNISSNKLDTNELCEQLFMLKNNFLPILNKNNIKTLEDINIENLLNVNFQKLCVAFKCNTEELYTWYNYVAFNLRTTGIKIQSNDIIEIAAIKIQFGQVVDTFHTYVNPLKSISIAIESKTHISNKMLQASPTLDVALQAFRIFSGNLTLISHNSNSNYEFLKYNYKKLFDKELSYNTKCTMKLYRTRYKNFYGEPPKKFSLDHCCKDLLDYKNISTENKSTPPALVDALNTYKLYEILKFKYK